jgi:hypothetical protein
MDKLKQNGLIYQRNGPNGTLIGSWYPKSRPLQHYRNRGKRTNTLDAFDDTYWLFNNVMIHVVFGTFWFDGYGYVLLQGANPVTFILYDLQYTLESVDSEKAVWRTSADTTVAWEKLVKTTNECEPKPVYVKQFKMLGKTGSDHTAPKCCLETTKTGDLLNFSGKGSIISFSGRAAIRPSSTLSSKNYFSDTSQYLRSRGSSYTANSVLAKIPGVDYTDGCNVVWPNQPQEVNGETLNSSMFGSTCTDSKCDRNRTVYKPSNSQYATQGAVTASERIVRIRANMKPIRTTITGKKLA